jgi:hypothetical protein
MLESRLNVRQRGEFLNFYLLLTIIRNQNMKPLSFPCYAQPWPDEDQACFGISRHRKTIDPETSSG